MLSGYWLLSDLDGTLISTPHKAQGQYLPMTRSPCCDPIRRWLLNGGNVCIVTTADQRVIDQVYLPLRDCLGECEERCGEYHDRLARRESHAHGAVEESMNGTVSKVRKSGKRLGGKLLLSLYTGAVLYLCTSKSVYLLPGYANAMHCATREAVELTRAFHVELPTAPLLMEPSSTSSSSSSSSSLSTEVMVACVRGTCINRTTSDTLQACVKVIYGRYLRDILYGEPAVVNALKRMSTRYKKMWRAILTFLEHLFLYSKGRKWAVAPLVGGNDFSMLYSGAEQSAESKEWKTAFFNHCDGLLAALGILRVEYVEAEVFFGGNGSDGAGGHDATGGVFSASSYHHPHRKAIEATERRRRQELADHELVVSHATDVLVRGAEKTVQDPALKPLVRKFAVHMTGLLGTDPRDLKKRLSNTPATYDDVAQVIVLGLPFSLFSRYFAPSVPDFIRGGVQAVPQPNSVVFSKTGVSKSTTLRYLLGKDRVTDDSSSLTTTKPSENNLGAAFTACVAANCAISLGDNPHTTDYELTVFHDVNFISVEKQSQRDERHRRIARRLLRTKAIEDRGEKPTLPDGRPAPTYAELTAMLKKSGPMMDDRLLQNILYVGGEEEGTAVLLATLMDRLRVPPLMASTGHVADEDVVVDEPTFQRTLAGAQASARRRVQASLFSHI